MAELVRTGAYSYIKYDWESAYGGDDATKTKIFGKEQKLTPMTFTPNMQALRQLESIEVESYGFMRNEGSGTLEWVLSNPWWLRGIFSNPTKAGSAPVTYTYDSSVAASKDIESMAIEVGFDAETQDIVRTLLGVIFKNVNLTARVNDFARVSSSIQWTKEGTVGTSVGSGVSEDSGSAFGYTFVHGSLSVDGSLLAQVQSADISFALNSDPLWGLNSANGADAFRRGFDITGKFQVSEVDKTLFQKVLDRTEINTTPDLVLTFSNGLSGASEKSITFTGTGLGLSEHSVNHEPVEPVFDNINWQIRNMVVTADNQTASEP